MGLEQQLLLLYRLVRVDMAPSGQLSNTSFLCVCCGGNKTVAPFLGEHKCCDSLWMEVASVAPSWGIEILAALWGTEYQWLFGWGVKPAYLVCME